MLCVTYQIQLITNCQIFQLLYGTMEHLRHSLKRKRIKNEIKNKNQLSCGGSVVSTAVAAVGLKTHGRWSF